MNDLTLETGDFLTYGTAGAGDQGLFIEHFLQGPSKIDETQLGVRTSNLAVTRNAFFARSDYGPTGLTILAAAACAYGELAKTPCEEIILQLNGHLGSAPSWSFHTCARIILISSLVAVQEALLLAMLRISVTCSGGVPDEVVQNVKALSLVSGRHIKLVRF